MGGCDGRCRGSAGLRQEGRARVVGCYPLTMEYLRGAWRKLEGARRNRMPQIRESGYGHAHGHSCRRTVGRWAGSHIRSSRGRRHCIGKTDFREPGGEKPKGSAVRGTRPVTSESQTRGVSGLRWVTRTV